MYQDPPWCGCGSNEPGTVHKRVIRRLVLGNDLHLADHADRAAVTIEASDADEHPSIYVGLEADARPVARVRLSDVADLMESGLRDLDRARELGLAIVEAVDYLRPFVPAA